MPTISSITGAPIDLMRGEYFTSPVNMETVTHRRDKHMLLEHEPTRAQTSTIVFDAA